MNSPSIVPFRVSANQSLLSRIAFLSLRFTFSALGVAIFRRRIRISVWRVRILRVRLTFAALQVPIPGLQVAILRLRPQSGRARPGRLKVGQLEWVYVN